MEKLQSPIQRRFYEKTILYLTNDNGFAHLSAKKIAGGHCESPRRMGGMKDVQTHRIRVEGEEGVFHSPAGEVVLAALERGRVRAVRIGCRQGGCGACRVRVLSGRYTTKRMSRAHVSIAEEAEGFALSCRLLAESDLVLRPAFAGPRGAAGN